MNVNDEELQDDLVNGRTPYADPMDIKAYRKILRALEKNPGFELRPGFAEKTVARLVAQQQANRSRDYFWFGAGIFFLIASAIATVLFTGFTLNFGFLNVMSDYKGLAIFGVLFIGLLNWLDKRLVIRKHARL